MVFTVVLVGQVPAHRGRDQIIEVKLLLLHLIECNTANCNLELSRLSYVKPEWIDGTLQFCVVLAHAETDAFNWSVRLCECPTMSE